MKKGMIFILSVIVSLSMAACSGTGLSLSGPEGGSDEIAMESGDIFEAELAESKEAGNDSASMSYEIGDIILADGSVIKEADLISIDSSNLPIAVIAGCRGDGATIGIGVHRSDSPLPWAADESMGYTAKFTDIVCAQDSGSVFTGDVDGSDNWAAICAQDESNTVYSSESYPAFSFANTYAETYELTGAYASGWYMPSIAELYEVYQNRETVNSSLQKIYGLDSNVAMNGLGTNWYWSSSQASSEDDYAWFVHYFNGYAGECPKNFTNVHVLVVRKF